MHEPVRTLIHSRDVIPVQAYVFRISHVPQEGAEEAASLLMIQRVFLATKSFSRYDAQSTVSSEDVQRLFSLSCSRLPLDCAVAGESGVNVVCFPACYHDVPYVAYQNHLCFIHK